MTSNLENAELKKRLHAFTAWRHEHLRGDEKGEAQSFIDRLFRAFGHAGVQEAGAEFESRVRTGEAKRVGFADLMWKPRVLIEMKKSGTDLRRHYKQAFDYWLHAVPERPRYVILCNFDQFWIYDFDSQLDEPIDRVQIDQIADRWESLAFMLPVPERPVFGNDLVAVTRAAAAQVGTFFRSLIERGVDREVAQRFSLQCVMAMFSEDVGLLPRHSFTEAINDATSGEEAYDLLGTLFREMNTVGITAGGRYRGTPYFNGGLFYIVQPIELNMEEVRLLRDAASTNWSDVRPEIFGTLFEGSMSAGERHARGAHFTSQADIMRIVNPCIVEPWRDRIEGAKGGIGKLRALLNDLMSFRVLDPACGSGNFLYVAYRELKRIENEILERLKSLSPLEQPSFSYVNIENFLGLDVDPFAVEIAKVTMQLGKKMVAIEFGEGGSVLPLDNLNSSIRACDALFEVWPRANVIVGNPPYLGNRKMVEELGAGYVSKLAEKFGPKGVADFVTYWYPIAHDNLSEGARAGFVGTKSVAQGDGRKASLDYIIDNGGAIIEAYPMIPWSGEANVTVSIVNWQKGGLAPARRLLWLDEGERPVEVAEISSRLSPATDLRTTRKLQSSQASFYQGQTPGIVRAFKISADDARSLVDSEPADSKVIHPFLGGEELLHSVAIDDWIIDIPDTDADVAWRRYPKLLKSLESTAMTERVAKAERQRLDNDGILRVNPKAKTRMHHIRFADHWWLLAYRRSEMLKALSGLPRYLALTRTSSELRGPVFTFVAPEYRPSDSIVAFPFADEYSFGILQSALHTEWFREKCTTLETRLTYTSRTVGEHFPWPQDPSRSAVERIEDAAVAIIDYRAQAFSDGASLASQYDVLRRPGSSSLRSLHAELDSAVMEAYGFDASSDALSQLLALNHELAELEMRGEEVVGPGPLPNSRVLTTWALQAPTL